MSGVSIDDFGASFVHYLPGTRETIRRSTRALALFKGKLKWEGKNLSWHVHVAPNTSIGMTEDGGALEPAGKQTYVEAKASRRFLYATVQVTDGILNNASTTKHAAITVVKSELDGVIDFVRKFKNFFCTRDGTGVVGTVKQIVVGGAATLRISDARAIWDGKNYEIRNSGGTLLTDFRAVRTARAFSSTLGASVTVDNNWTAAEAAASSVGDLVVWGSGNYSAYELTSGKPRMFTGLDALIDDGTSGTFQNVSLSSYPRYTSPVLTATGGVTPNLFRRMLALIQQECGDAPPSGMNVLTNVWQSINVEEMYEGELRITPDTKVAGFAIASFMSTLGRINIINDPDAPYGKMFFVDPAEITPCVQRELDFRRNENGGIFTIDPGALAHRASLLEMFEYVIDQRNKCGKIEGLTESVDTAY